ncbi:hypothetical protein [Antrihabitans spumae]|uniref:DUF445 domain-containing protein n=1 Tax=Antrihabitans spumae TaxID=3373370 RepID=A0ABW7K7U6_9NOCA
MSAVALSGIIDWHELAGWSTFTIELVTIPIFSAVAGLITNWTGVWMLFALVKFAGFRVPGLAAIYPWFPRRVQILPIFAAGGRFGFQGFIPARSEKMASMVVDKAISRIGGPSDFFRQLEPAAIANQFASIIASDLRSTVDAVIQHAYPDLLDDLPPRVREVVYARVAEELPELANRAFNEIGEHVDELLNVKTMIIECLAARPELLKDVVQGIGAPELRFMVRSGLLGFPFGILLALYLHVHHSIPVVGVLPNWLVILCGAAMIGVTVNVIAVRVVFTPAVAKPWYLCPWRQARFARRQEAAATDFGHAIAHQVITMPVIVGHLIDGPNGDKTKKLLNRVLAEEIDRILGRMKPLVSVAVGARRMKAIRRGSTSTAIAVVPELATDPEFNRVQAQKLDLLCAQKLRELPPEDFVELLYCAVEQDAWLLYLHGAVLGVAVGCVHLLIFGA